MLMLKKTFEDASLDLAAIEGLVPMHAMKAGTAERDTEIEGFCQVIRNMGALEIPVLCCTGWYSSRGRALHARARRGAGVEL